jgi:hypothetical protein
MRRFYRLDVQSDLFGQWCLIREWGAQAGPGRCGWFFIRSGYVGDSAIAGKSIVLSTTTADVPPCAPATAAMLIRASGHKSAQRWVNAVNRRG